MLDTATEDALKDDERACHRIVACAVDRLSTIAQVVDAPQYLASWQERALFWVAEPRGMRLLVSRLLEGETNEERRSTGNGL